MGDDLTDSGIPTTYEYLVMWTYRHEFMNANLSLHTHQIGQRECTGVLTMSKDGVVKHGRNSDQFPREARNLTLALRFIEHDGETNTERLLFSAVDWYWFTSGVRTAVRKGVASISGNGRDGAEGGPKTTPLQWVLDKIKVGAIPDMLLFRIVLLAENEGQEPPFERVLRMLATADLATPSYYVVAGSGVADGALIARGNDLNNSTEPRIIGNAVFRMGSAGINGRPPNWALVQSNYDVWKPDPDSDPRRKLATNLVWKYGQDLASSDLGLFAIMSTTPVHDTETAFTAVMCPATGSIQAFIKDALVPAPLNMSAWRASCAKQVTEYGSQCTKKDDTGRVEELSAALVT